MCGPWTKTRVVGFTSSSPGVAAVDVRQLSGGHVRPRREVPTHQSAVRSAGRAELATFAAADPKVIPIHVVRFTAPDAIGRSRGPAGTPLGVTFKFKVVVVESDV